MSKVLHAATVHRLRSRKRKVSLSDDRYGVLTVIPHVLTSHACCPSHGMIPEHSLYLDNMLGTYTKKDVEGPFMWYSRHNGYPIKLDAITLLCWVEFMCPHEQHVLRTYYEPVKFGMLVPGSEPHYYEPDDGEEVYPALDAFIRSLRRRP